MVSLGEKSWLPQKTQKTFLSVIWESINFYSRGSQRKSELNMKHKSSFEPVFESNKISLGEKSWLAQKTRNTDISVMEGRQPGKK